MQRAGAFVAKADDPSAILHNPAGLSRLTRIQAEVGTNLIDMDLRFSRFGGYADGQPFPEAVHNGPAQPLPYVGVVVPIGRFSLALGIYDAHGYSRRDFPATVITATGEDLAAPQRYDVVSQQVSSTSVSLAGSYRITDRLSIGVRLSAGMMSLHWKKYVQALPNEEEDSGNDALVEVSGRDNFVPSAGLGMHYRLSNSLEIGLAVKSPTFFHASGRSSVTLGANVREIVGDQTGLVPVSGEMTRCGSGGTAEALRTCIDITLPAAVSIGMRAVARDGAGRERGDLEIDARWENWSQASSVRLTIDGMSAADDTPIAPLLFRQGLRDVYSVRLGSSGRFALLGQTVEVRAGVGYESAAAPASWAQLSVDGAERFIGTTGVGVELGGFRVDLGVGYIASPTRQVRGVTAAGDALGQPNIQVPLAGDQGPRKPYNAGEYKVSYLIGSAGICASF
jgi:long-chain fatty acid transport protein